MNKLTKWWQMRNRTGMSELGRELLEAMEGDDVWEADEYRIKHRASGIEFWVANGLGHFKISRIPGHSLKEELLDTALTEKDRKVLWAAYKVMLQRHESAPARIALNTLRLGRMKESNPV